MSMRTLRLTVHPTPEQALCVIEAIDHLREQLDDAYGDELAAMLREVTVRASQMSGSGADPPF